MNFTVSREELHHDLYLFGLALLVCCLPLSRFLLSISQFLLLINWILEGRLREKTGKILHTPAIWLPASIFLLYCLGMLYTGNTETGLARMKNALPLLVLPLITGTSQQLTSRNIKHLLLLFVVATVVAALVCLIAYFIDDSATEGDFRKLSLFMLHIRFSLMIVFAILILLYLVVFAGVSSTRPERILFSSLAFFLIGFLFFLRSFTGIIIFLILAVILLLNTAMRMKQRTSQVAILLTLTFALLIMIGFPVHTYVRNFHSRPPVADLLEEFTASGNRYTHDITTRVMENGHYIDIYLCEPELRQEWNRVSRVPYDSADHKGQPVGYTLRRYLTSKGLRKDSAAVSCLDSTDISNIENGLANCTFHNNPGFYQRLYETLWEIQLWKKTGYVMHHSLGQRIAFYKAALTVFQANILTGVGTGDVYETMLLSAGENSLIIDPRWEGKPHNQFVFYLLAFGVPGFLYILFCLGYPVVVRKTYRLFLFNVVAAILVLSMLVLDTLESYDSMVFFAFFYSFFLYGGVRPLHEKA